MKIKLQINGESLDLIKPNEEMNNSEYEVIINDIDIKNLVILENILSRAINDGTDELFNSNIIEMK